MEDFKQLDISKERDLFRTIKLTIFKGSLCFQKVLSTPNKKEVFEDALFHRLTYQRSNSDVFGRVVRNGEGTAAAAVNHDKFMVCECFNESFDSKVFFFRDIRVSAYVFKSVIEDAIVDGTFFTSFRDGHIYFVSLKKKKVANVFFSSKRIKFALNDYVDFSIINNKDNYHVIKTFAINIRDIPSRKEADETSLVFNQEPFPEFTLYRSGKDTFTISRELSDGSEISEEFPIKAKVYFIDFGILKTALILRDYKTTNIILSCPLFLDDLDGDVLDHSIILKSTDYSSMGDFTYAIKQKAKKHKSKLIIISGEKELRDELNRLKFNFHYVLPEKEIRDKYVEKLQENNFSESRFNLSPDFGKGEIPHYIDSLEKSGKEIIKEILSE